MHRERNMEDFPTLYSFMIFTKGWTYVLMGVALVGFLGYWRFLFGRDERTGQTRVIRKELCMYEFLTGPMLWAAFSSS